MSNFIVNSTYFGVVISIGAYLIGIKIKKRFKIDILNPLLIAIVLVIVFLLLFNIDYSTYSESSKYLSYLLTPATICLAVPLYQQRVILKKYYRVIFIGILMGVISSLTSILLFALLFKLSHADYVTLLPKSITTAIGMALSGEMGGIPSITVISIVITGIFGNVFAISICKFAKIKNRIAVGIAIGTASHAVGTAKAMEIGDVEGAMSSLSIVVSGILTVVLMMVYINFI